ncbi:MAG: cytochrome b/b6 domain-containing protein [Clostridiaceae bacterium]|nr:cytochrome b/b6 domain-containing protein [Clostridiaceae bacterium]
MMNNSVKLKIFLDIGMAILFILLMNTRWTGVLWHEILSLIVIGLFTVHLLLNKTWITKMCRGIRKKMTVRAKGLFYLNVLLTAAMAVTLLSGILISQYLFAPLASQSDISWRDIHSVASWISLTLLVLHAILHAGWIAGLLRRYAPAAGLKVMAARVLIGVLALAALYSLATNSTLDILFPALSSDQNSQTAGVQTIVSQTAGSQTIQSASEEEKITAILPSQTTQTSETAMTLTEYLSKLRCTGCHKHCLLSRPACSKGERQAEEATADYDAGQVTEEADGV